VSGHPAPHWVWTGKAGIAGVFQSQNRSPNNISNKKGAARLRLLSFNQYVVQPKNHC